MSIRYTLRHNIPSANLAEEDVNDSSTWDLNLLRKHELAETDNHDIVYRKHDGEVVNWAEAATQQANDILEEVQGISADIDNQVVVVENRLAEIEEEAVTLTEEAEAANEAAQEALVQAGLAVTESQENAESAENNSTLAQEWASKMDGIVDNTDYSSKYYAQQAGASATSASSSASTATTAKNNAQTSATNASNSATLAQQWATKTDGKVDSTDYSAKHYALSCVDSATSAASSASTATTKASEASTSASTASTKATAASGSADEAKDWANKTSGTVDGSEYSAKYYANNASTSATNAATSEGNASGSASAASGSATLAEDWATKTSGTVDGTEYSSKHYAGLAATSATNAATSEGNASGSASDASGYATAANNAKTAAEAARDEILDMRDYYGLPVGYEYFTTNPNIPQGSLPLFGGEYSRDTYSDLWEWVQEQTGYCLTESDWQDLSTAQNGNVPYYSDGDGSTTFRVPALNCWMRSANGTVSEVGSYLQAGLPNITGNASYGGVVGLLYSNSPDSASGTFYANLSKTGGTLSTTSGSSYSIGIDASRSSSIYGNSSTVQPASVVGMWLVKAYGTVAETGVINEQQYIDDRLGTKLSLTGGTMLAPIGFNAQGQIGFRGTTHTTPYDICKQMIVTAGTVESAWDDGNAKLCLHTYDDTGTNTAENGAFVLQASDGTNAPYLEGFPNGDLKWNGKDVITSAVTGEIKRTSGNSSTVNTTVTLCSITSHSAGNWLIVGHIDLNTSINNSYNTIIAVSGGTRVIRGSGLNGGGQCCIWIKYLSTNETVSLQGWIPSSATMRGTLEMIRLA